MPKIRYNGLFDGTTEKAIHIGHHETLYLHLLLPAIYELKKEEEDDLLNEMDKAVAAWAVQELLTVGFVSAFHLWERQFREFVVEQSAQPEIKIPKQASSEGLIAYARRVMTYFETQIDE